MFIALRNKYRVAAVMLLALQANVIAAPGSVENFEKNSWQQLLRQTASPTIVVFSSVTCTHCPGAINRIAAGLSAARSRTRLFVVSIDSEDDAALLQDPHLASVSRLFAFNGSAQALQYAVNPGWRGMTPYIAYLDGKRGVRFVLGEPKEAVLREWLAAGR
jgi:hypothetical protein